MIHIMFTIRNILDILLAWSTRDAINDQLQNIKYVLEISAKLSKYILLIIKTDINTEKFLIICESNQQIIEVNSSSRSLCSDMTMQ